MDVEDNWPASFRGVASWNPHVEIEAVFFLEDFRLWRGVFVLEQDITEFIDWLRADRTESRIVSRFPRRLVEGKGRW